MNLLNKKILLAAWCLVVWGLMFSLVNGVTIQTDGTAKHTSKLKALHLNKSFIKSSDDGSYLQISEWLKWTGLNNLRTSASNIIWWWQENKWSDSIIWGWSGNTATSWLIIWWENNTSSSGGIVAWWSNHINASDHGVVLWWEGNTAADSSLSMWKNSVAEWRSFSRNSIAKNKNSAIGASSGLLVWTTENTKSANVIVNWLIKYEDVVSPLATKGEIRVSSWFFYAYDGKWHLIWWFKGICDKATAKNCIFWARELKDWDTVVG